MTRSPLVGMEDAIAEELVLAELGVAERPCLASRYVILGIRGRGARGLVCRATDIRLDRVVALKLYPPIGDPRIEAEIAREAKALARLDHPNVVRVHDVALGTLVLGGRALETSYLSMELVEGKNLRAWLSDGARDSARILRVVRSIGAALVAAHARGIVHRDVKPENVMIDEEGEVRVVDFGLARSIANADEGSERTSDPHVEGVVEPLATSFGKLTGTVEYMAPEAREGAADARSDQFSFAVTAWECLSGVLPFDARSEVCRDPRIRPLDGTDTIPDQFRMPLQRAMDRDPAARFPTVEALLEAMSPPRSRVLAWVLAAGVLGVAGLAAALSFGGSVPQRLGLDASLSPDAPLDAGVDASWDAAVDAGRDGGVDAYVPRILDRVIPNADDCLELLGTWEVTTTVETSRARSVPLGTRSYFTFRVDPNAACDVEILVVKRGDDTNAIGDAGRLYTADDVRDDHRRVQLSLRDGYVGFDEIFGLASVRRARREFRFDVHQEGPRLLGSFFFKDVNGHLVLGGSLVGTKLAEGQVPFSELIAAPEGTPTVSEP